MDTNKLDQQMSQMRLVLLGLVVLIVILICVGGFAFGSLYTQVQQQKLELAHISAAVAAATAAEQNDPTDF